jgi:hypothetical protein
MSGFERDRAGRFEEPGMYSVGSGMVLAIGDLAGDVTLLAATATQFARAGRLWEVEVAVAAGLVGNGPRHRRPSVAAVL